MCYYLQLYICVICMAASFFLFKKERYSPFLSAASHCRWLVTAAELELHTRCSISLWYTYFEVQDRPGHIYLFGGNKEWNSSEILTIFEKVRQFRAVLRAIWLKYQLLQVQTNCWHFRCLFNWAYVQLEITTLCWLSLWLQSKYDCSL